MDNKDPYDDDDAEVDWRDLLFCLAALVVVLLAIYGLIHLVGVIAR